MVATELSSRYEEVEAAVYEEEVPRKGSERGVLGVFEDEDEGFSPCDLDEEFLGVLEGSLMAGLGTEFGFRTGSDALTAIFDLHITEQDCRNGDRYLGIRGRGIKIWEDWSHRKKNR